MAEAEGESQRFLSVLKEYERAEDVTRKRLFLETMERVFQGSNKIILDGREGRACCPICRSTRLQRNRPRAPLRTPSQATGTPNPDAGR